MSNETKIPAVTDEMVKAARDALGSCVGSCGEASPPEFCDIKDAIEAALAAAPAATHAAAEEPAKWRPIETAPKDGTRILLTNGESVAEGRWEHQAPYVREKRDLEGRYIDQDEFDGFDGWIDFDGGMLPEPTHWMPLPDRPLMSQS